MTLIHTVFSTLVCTKNARSAVAYTSPKSVVKLTRMRREDNRRKSDNFLLTVGAPNFREREFIRSCQKAGEPFPVKKVQLKFFK